MRDSFDVSPKQDYLRHAFTCKVFVGGSSSKKGSKPLLQKYNKKPWSAFEKQKTISTGWHHQTSITFTARLSKHLKALATLERCEMDCPLSTVGELRLDYGLTRLQPLGSDSQLST